MVTKKITPAVQRSLDVIDYFRGAPGEFDMLKGLLILDSALEKGERARNGYPAAHAMHKRVHALYDTQLIAERMDAINDEAKRAA